MFRFLHFKSAFGRDSCIYARCVGNYVSHGGYVMRTCSIQACLSRLLFRFSLNRFTTFCALTLGHFSAYNRPSLSFLFLPFLQVIQRPGTSSGSSSAVSSITPSNFTNFRPQTSKGPFAKGRYDICFASVTRPIIGEPIAPTYTSLPDQPTNSSKVCQVKTASFWAAVISLASIKQ